MAADSGEKCGESDGIFPGWNRAQLYGYGGCAGFPVFQGAVGGAGDPPGSPGR